MLRGRSVSLCSTSLLFRFAPVQFAALFKRVLETLKELVFMERLAEMNDRDKVILDLNLLASIKPGQTISTSTMTLINHGSWSTSFWRRYKGETRNDTLACITRILSQGRAHSLVTYVEE